MSVGLLHHVEMYVSNLKKSTTFWKWFLEDLGYVESQKWEHGVSFKLGDTYLVFVQVLDQFKTPAFHRCRVGLNHLAFHARDRAHVEQVKTELQKRGVPILYPEEHPDAEDANYYALYFEDPDRIKVELVAKS